MRADQQEQGHADQQDHLDAQLTPGDEVAQTGFRFQSVGKVEGLAGTSQPLMNWKLRAYAAHRRDFDPAALQVEGEPPLVLPAMPRATGVPTEDQVALRNAALAVRARFGDADLFVPAGQRARTVVVASRT